MAACLRKTITARVLRIGRGTVEGSARIQKTPFDRCERPLSDAFGDDSRNGEE
jgi:hypothetical protein